MTNISPKIKLVVWDLDGTLVDSFKLLSAGFVALAPKFGAQPPTKEKLLQNFHGSLRETIQSVFMGELSEEQVNKFFEEFVDSQKVHYIDAEAQLLDDAVALSKRLNAKNIKQVLVTNRLHVGHDEASPRSIVERSSLKEHIHHVICGDDSKHRKPNKEVLAELLKDLKVAPEELLVIGDQHVDAQFALNLGCEAIIVERYFFAKHHLQDENWQERITVVQSLDEVQV